MMDHKVMSAQPTNVRKTDATEKLVPVSPEAQGIRETVKRTHCKGKH